ncbi:hypothetical protein [Rubrobacter indicoceani]|nr:hypothetical protein [Rubrobacter indicoceani]
MRGLTERRSYNPRHTRNLFFAGMSGLLVIFFVVLLYILCALF